MVANIRTTFRHIRSFDELSELIARETRKLHETFHQITSCKVVIDRSHQHHGNGNRLRIQVVVSTPGKQLIASSEAEEGYPDILAAVREAFDIMGNSISSYVHRRDAIRQVPQDERLSIEEEHPFDRRYQSINSRHF